MAKLPKELQLEVLSEFHFIPENFKARNNIDKSSKKFIYLFIVLLSI